MYEFKIALIIASIIFYIIGFFAWIHGDTMINVKYHENGGLFDMGYTTHENREATPRDVRKALLWPIKATIYFTKSIIWIINEDVVSIFLLIFGFEYKKTKVYRYLKRVMD